VNNIDRALAASGSAAEFARRYTAYLSSLLAELDVGRLEELAQVLETARADDRTVFLIGNGGSAATASHWANDLMLGTAAAGAKLRALSLADSVPALTALANDRAYADVFVGQLQGLFRRGDVLIAISASGNSPNVVQAVEWVNREGGTTVGILGFDGGRLKSLCRIPIVIATPAGEYGPVEDLHMVIDHLVTAWLKHRFGTRP
jgi:D-sedoheptulose 7-phosphate isomerase